MLQGQFGLNLLIELVVVAQHSFDKVFCIPQANAKELLAYLATGIPGNSSPSDKQPLVSVLIGQNAIEFPNNCDVGRRSAGLDLRD